MNKRRRYKLKARRAAAKQAIRDKQFWNPARFVAEKLLLDKSFLELMTYQPEPE